MSCLSSSSLRSGSLVWRLAIFIALLLTTAVAETLPPAPKNHFNDYAGVVSPSAVEQLNRRLEQYERESSNQLLVAVYRRMESESSVQDYTVRIAQSWKVGQKDKSNGAVLFVFVDNRQIYLQVGYGLEAVITDAIARRIIDREIKPRFRVGDYQGGLAKAVDAMIAASQGEYKGTGQTQADRQVRSNGGAAISLFVFLCIIIGGILLLVTVVIKSIRGGGLITGPTVIGSRRHAQSVWWNPPGGGFGGFGGGNSGGGSSGSFGGGGGSFSGGGGSFGGGGAGGSW